MNADNQKLKSDIRNPTSERNPKLKARLLTLAAVFATHFPESGTGLPHSKTLARLSGASESPPGFGVRPPLRRFLDLRTILQAQPLSTFLRWLRPPRFAKYRPADRLGTRRVEDRLLRRFNPAMLETAQ